MSSVRLRTENVNADNGLHGFFAFVLSVHSFAGCEPEGGGAAADGGREPDHGWLAFEVLAIAIGRCVNLVASAGACAIAGGEVLRRPAAGIALSTRGRRATPAEDPGRGRARQASGGRRLRGGGGRIFGPHQLRTDRRVRFLCAQVSGGGGRSGPPHAGCVLTMSHPASVSPDSRVGGAEMPPISAPVPPKMPPACAGLRHTSTDVDGQQKARSTASSRRSRRVTQGSQGQMLDVCGRPRTMIGRQVGCSSGPAGRNRTCICRLGGGRSIH